MQIITESKKYQHVVECNKCHAQLRYNYNDVYNNYIYGYKIIICPVCKTEIICGENNLINELNKHHIY